MESPFYKDGLRFSCARCSACCRGGPGYVFLSRQDVSRLLSRLELDFRSFFKKYCILVNNGEGFALSLSEKSNFDCIFWTDQGCAVYDDRPLQCSTYPFWSSLVESSAAWKRESSDCPGIGRGEIRSREHIEECLWKRRAEGLIILDPLSARKPEDIDVNSILGR